VAIVLHDPVPCSGRRLIDRLRRASQLFVLRRAHASAERSIFTIPTDRAGWLADGASNATTFIPVGANFAGTQRQNRTRGPGEPLTVAVFGVTGGERGEHEVRAIAQTMASVCKYVPRLRLTVMGRGGDEAAALLRSELQGVPIELDVNGVLAAEGVERKLRDSDVLLFLRDGISSRRGSGIAGIVCGLPVVAYACAETAPPITEAGVLLAPQGNVPAVAEALKRVLTDASFRMELRERSARANERYFSWRAIAGRFVDFIDPGARQPSRSQSEWVLPKHEV
jgi:glycosyltransferase involved in cell wall biosynthesis